MLYTPRKPLNARQDKPEKTTIDKLLKDEDSFMCRAGVRELTQAVLHFRTLASKATTPQLRDFYLDRANQFAFRTTNLLRAGT